jgi:hypothetical protein
MIREEAEQFGEYDPKEASGSKKSSTNYLNQSTSHI